MIPAFTMGGTVPIVPDYRGVLQRQASAATARWEAAGIQRAVRMARGVRIAYRVRSIALRLTDFDGLLFLFCWRL